MRKNPGTRILAEVEKFREWDCGGDGMVRWLALPFFLVGM